MNNIDSIKTTIAGHSGKMGELVSKIAQECNVSKASAKKIIQSLTISGLNTDEQKTRIIGLLAKNVLSSHREFKHGGGVIYYRAAENAARTHYDASRALSKA